MTTISETRRSEVACPRWRGNPRQYQIRAQALYSEHHARVILPWSWTTTTCGHDDCLNPRHMRLHQPRRIAYAEGVCVYCGDPAGTMDHLLPEPSTGKALRGMVAVVPACGNCNSRINDFPSPNIGDRRRRAQLSIERGYRNLLARPIKTAAEMRQLGHAMRTVAVKNNHLTEHVLLRLAWPHDPFYDLRAFQKSGIDDPVTLGLCDELATPLRPEYAA